MKYIIGIAISLFILSCKTDKKDPAPQNKQPTVVQVKQDNTNDLSNYQLLQGAWQNVQDTLSVIVVDDDMVINRYNNEITGTPAKMTLDDKCLQNPDPNRPLEKDRYLSITGNFNDCYYITILDKENLTLSFLNGGFDLVFKKVEKY